MFYPYPCAAQTLYSSGMWKLLFLIALSVAIFVINPVIVIAGALLIIVWSWATKPRSGF